MPVSPVTSSRRTRFIYIAEESTGASKQATARATYDRATRLGRIFLVRPKQWPAPPGHIAPGRAGARRHPVVAGNGYPAEAPGLDRWPGRLAWIVGRDARPGPFGRDAGHDHWLALAGRAAG
jgi:hypothetical protein